MNGSLSTFNNRTWGKPSEKGDRSEVITAQTATDINHIITWLPFRTAASSFSPHLCRWPRLWSLWQRYPGWARCHLHTWGHQAAWSWLHSRWRSPGKDIESLRSSRLCWRYRGDETTYSTVLHHQPFMGHQQLLQRKNDPPQIGFVFVVVKLPLSVEDVVHRHHVVLITHTHEQTCQRWSWRGVPLAASRWQAPVSSTEVSECRWCKLCLCCSFLSQSLIIGPALSSRTELNTLNGS